MVGSMRKHRAAQAGAFLGAGSVVGAGALSELDLASVEVPLERGLPLAGYGAVPGGADRTAAGQAVLAVADDVSLKTVRQP